jgi:hypothetical protein
MICGSSGDSDGSSNSIIVCVCGNSSSICGAGVW